MEYVVFGWLGALIIFIIIEIATVNLATIWFAAGSLAALILNLCKAPFAAQAVVFFVVSLAMLIFARPYLEKLIKRGEIKTNVDSLVGKTAKVTETINNSEGEGTAVINGQEWTARAEDDARIIKEGEMVEVVSISGVKLIVK